MNDVWLMIVGMAAVTFAVRYPVLVLVGRVPLPQSVFRALRYVPIAVLTAICAPEVFKASATTTLDLPSLVAGVVACGLSWRTKNLLLTIVVGMGVYLLLRGALG